MKTIKQVPCTRDCPQRIVCPNCHMSCAAYLEWRRSYDALRQAIKDANESEKPNPRWADYRPYKRR